ncbi:hypothetical protein EDB86DRAFT_2832241 [Lactarius hatsudake]|nr:hypothetical protein EDB86DRAFT_2832241 [Lactarius hatsudake]
MLRDPKAMQATLERFVRLDALIAHAGAVSDLNQNTWISSWATRTPSGRAGGTHLESGVFNAVRDKDATLLPTLEKTSGRIVVTSSVVAQLRFLCASDYAISKQAVNRLVEFISLVQLPAATMLYLSLGCIDWSNTKSARYFPGLPTVSNLTNARILSSNWNPGEVEGNWKEKVQVKNAHVNKLAIPK